jgi:hypothetical protein
MPSYTTSLKLIQPSAGEYPGTWGTEVNNRLTALVDKAVAGTTSITMTAANYTLTNADGVADEAKSMFLVLGGTPGASYAVIVPSVSKLYFVTNNTGFAQTVRASGTGISVPNGASMTLRCDGTNVVVAQNYFASMTLGAALPVASGGTGLTSYTSGGVVYASSTSALATGSGLVFDGTNLGIGTSSPSSFDSAWQRLVIGTGTGDVGQAIYSGSASIGTIAFADGTTGVQQYAGLIRYLHASDAMTFWAGATERMRLDASGNLGIGTVSPSSRLDVNGAGIVRGFLTTTDAIKLGGNTSAPSTTDAFIYRPADNTLAFGTGSTERARITSGGDLLVGTTSFGAAGRVTTASASANGNFISNNTAGSGTRYHCVFYENGTERGSITSNGSTTSYVTSSDYRLKEDIAPMTGALAKVTALKPVTYKWKSTGEAGEGFIAHELAEVCSDAVIGEKDAVNEDGSIKSQGIDTSFLVATLTAAIQEQQALITALTARVAALEQA